MNFTDPFGLFACCTAKEAQEIASQIATRVTPLESFLNTIGTFLGINGLAEGAEQIGEGRVASGALTLAMSLPIGPGEEARGVGTVLKMWHKATFADEAASAAYHVGKHGGGRSLVQYTKDAIDFFQANKARATSVTLKDGTQGLRIKTPGGRGGYFTPDGRVVTFWYK